MAVLPIVGSDRNTWGTILNAALTEILDTLDTVDENRPKAGNSWTAGGTISSAGDYYYDTGDGALEFSGLVPLASYSISFSVSWGMWAAAAARAFVGVRIQNGSGTPAVLLAPGRSTVSNGGLEEQMATWSSHATLTAQGDGTIVIHPLIQWDSGTTNAVASTISATVMKI